MRRVILALSLLFVTACGGAMRSVFYQNEKAIRFEHGGPETVLLQSIEPDPGFGAPQTVAILAATPTLLYVDNNQEVCPGPDANACGFVGDPPERNEWCDIFSWRNQRAVRLTRRATLDLSSGSINLRDLNHFCYFGLSSNSTQSLIAAALTVPMVGSGQQTEIKGMLVVREGSSWTGHTAIPGWGPEKKVKSTAVNHAGSHVAYDLDGEIFLAEVVSLPQATRCANGSLPNFGSLDGVQVLAWYDGGRFQAAPANASSCDTVTFTSTQHPTGTLISWGWSEFGSTAVYILKTASTFDVYEYDFSNDRHTRVLSNAEEKSSISILRN